ncbi:polysaccharide pyruvyl transferase family protein [Nitrospira sp. BLG_1]|uniref:polysaccharide pyruvyl transferase family protein n=1 Tax=Nitrospira sp. BLG_1 TaxID=3395883 RepID=UPI0039BD83CC
MENKIPTICLLGASLGASNMGVNALTAGTIKALFNRFPSAEVFMLDYGKERKTHTVEIGGRRIVTQVENMRFSKQVYRRNHIAMLLLLALIAKLVPFSNVRSKFISRNPCLKRLSDASFVTSIAGGDSFSDLYGIERFIYVSLPQLLTLFMGKRLILLPQTIGPFKGLIPRLVATYILQKAELVYSRDYQGVEDVNSLLGLERSKDKTKFCYDVGFILDSVRPRNTDLQFYSQKETKTPVVGLNISGLLYMGGYSKKNMFGLKVDYKELIPDLIEFVVGENNANVILIPHVFGSNDESDTMVCKEVYSLLKERYGGRLLLANGEYNQSEIKHIIGQCDFFVGSRMHACIAALSQNIPTVSIAYSRKFIGVMETIGVTELVADPRILTKEEIFSIVDNAFEQRTRFREHLERTMPRVKDEIMSLFNEIGSLQERL